MPELIEEDFRFTTQAQVDRYTEQDLRYKPHLSGYELTQLLDQLDERMLQHDGKQFRLFAMAPAGTALCLAMHFALNIKPMHLFLSLVKPWNDALLSTFRTMPHVTLVNPDSSYVLESDCVALVPRSAAKAAYDFWQTHPRMQSKPYVVFDPDRTFADVKSGRYFLNSSIWISP